MDGPRLHIPLSRGGISGNTGRFEERAGPACLGQRTDTSNDVRAAVQSTDVSSTHDVPSNKKPGNIANPLC